MQKRLTSIAFFLMLLAGLLSACGKSPANNLSPTFFPESSPSPCLSPAPLDPLSTAGPVPKGLTAQEYTLLQNADIFSVEQEAWDCYKAYDESDIMTVDGMDYVPADPGCVAALKEAMRVYFTEDYIQENLWRYLPQHVELEGQLYLTREDSRFFGDVPEMRLDGLAYSLVSRDGSVLVADSMMCARTLTGIQWRTLRYTVTDGKISAGEYRGWTELAANAFVGFWVAYNADDHFLQGYHFSEDGTATCWRSADDITEYTIYRYGSKQNKAGEPIYSGYGDGYIKLGEGDEFKECEEALNIVSFSYLKDYFIVRVSWDENSNDDMVYRRLENIWVKDGVLNTK